MGETSDMSPVDPESPRSNLCRARKKCALAVARNRITL